MMTKVPVNKKIQYHWSFKRFYKNIFLLSLITAIAIVLVTTGVKATFDNNLPQTINITVKPGDTLWSIAKQIEPNSDPRLVIQKIKEQNQMVVSNLEIGQSLEFQLEN